MVDQPNAAKAKALAAIIGNVKRLLGDARTLQESGSAGSAISLAILAFEEAGKGHIIKNGWEKPKHARSLHSYRHFMAFLVLQGSFTQKYALDMTGVQTKIAARFAALDIKPGSKTPLPPLDPALRGAMRADLLPQFARMTPEEKIIFGIEQRWLGKIALAVQQGQLEKIRQSGLYLDTDAQLTITSTPEAVQRIDAERWIWAATRVLNLLERGTFDQSYSPLAELMTAANNGDKEAADLFAAMKTMATEPKSDDTKA